MEDEMREMKERSKRRQQRRFTPKPGSAGKKAYTSNRSASLPSKYETSGNIKSTEATEGGIGNEMHEMKDRANRRQKRRLLNHRKETDTVTNTTERMHQTEEEEAQYSHPGALEIGGAENGPEAEPESNVDRLEAGLGVLVTAEIAPDTDALVAENDELKNKLEELQNNPNDRAPNLVAAVAAVKVENVESEKEGNSEFAKKVVLLIISLVIVTALALAISVPLTKKDKSEETPTPSTTPTGDIGGVGGGIVPEDVFLSETPTSAPWFEWIKSFHEGSGPESSWLIMDLSKDGKVLAVGYPGRYSDTSFQGVVRVYERGSDGIWNRRGGDLVGEAAGDEFGGHVVLSGDGNRLAIGAAYFDTNDFESAGKVTVYDYDIGSDTWVTVGGPIIGISSFSFASPLSLSSDGTVLAVDGLSSNSYTLIYKLNDQKEWTPIGDELRGTKASLSQDGRRVAIGESGGRGRVKIYEYFVAWDGWDVIGEIDGLQSSENFGASISMSEDGTRVAVGAPFGYLDTFTEIYGTVSVFEYSGTDTWTPLGSKLGGVLDGIIGRGRSISVSATGEYLAIGSESSVQVYRYIDNDWDRVGETIVSAEASFVSLSGDGKTVAAATGIHSNSGTLRVFELSSSNTPPPNAVTTTVSPSASSATPTATPTTTPLPTIGCNDNEYIFELELMTDNRAFEIEWMLSNGAGDIVESRPQNTYDDLQLYVYRTCLPQDCYRFEIIDDWSLNGLCCDYGEGYYAVSINGETIQTGAEFGHSDLIDFGETCTTPVP